MIEEKNVYKKKKKRKKNHRPSRWQYVNKPPISEIDGSKNNTLFDFAADTRVGIF